MRAVTLIGCLSLALGVGAGCGKKDDDGGGDKGGAAKGPAKAKGKAKAKGGGGIELASRTIEMANYTVTVDVPKGWNEMKFGGGLLFTKPGGVFASTFSVGETCEGNCAKIPENIKGMAANQVKMHASYYPTAKIVKEGPVAAGGGEFHLDLARKDGSKAVQYKQVRHKAEWGSKAVNCNAMLLKDDAKHVAMFKAACDGMKITPKAKK